MRDILFRGKRVDNDEWFFGDVLHNSNCVKIRENETDIDYIARSYQVAPETVGQYTGLKDKNGTKIFEGDIAKGNSEYFAYSHPHGIIVYDSGEFLIAFDKALEDVENLGAWANDIEVIGNIYDNPELLNGGDDNAEKIP